MMLTDELLDQLHKLDRANKLRVIQFLATDLITEEGSSLVMPDTDITIDKLLSQSPEDVYVYFALTLRASLASTEGLVALLGIILQGEHQNVVESLIKSTKKTRDTFNLLLDYLESLNK